MNIRFHENPLGSSWCRHSKVNRCIFPTFCCEHTKKIKPITSTYIYMFNTGSDSVQCAGTQQPWQTDIWQLMTHTSFDYQYDISKTSVLLKVLFSLPEWKQTWKYGVMFLRWCHYKIYVKNRFTNLMTSEIENWINCITKVTKIQKLLISEIYQYYMGNWYSSFCIVTRYMLDGQGISDLFPSGGKRLLFFFTASISALGPTHSPIQWVPESVSP